MTYLIGYAVLSTVAALVLWLRWRDAEARLRMPSLPLKLPKLPRKRARGKR